MPKELEKGVNAPKLDDGKADVIAMLYNDDQISLIKIY